MLQWWGELGEAERLQLVSELEEVDLAEMEDMWRSTCGEASTAARDRDMSSMAPVGGYTIIQSSSSRVLISY